MLHSQSPRIDSIDPAQGPIAGGTMVTITGANFQGTTLSVDKVAVTPQAISATAIRFTSVPHDNGIASIKVANDVGAAYSEFLFVPPRLQDLPLGYITTVAGIGRFKGYYRPATRASIDAFGGMAFDPKGNLYIAEQNEDRVSRVSVEGILEPFAGNGFDPFGDTDIGDGGPATEARINFPRGMTTDEEGNVFIAEQFHRIRRVDGRTGIISTVAGNAGPGFAGDGGPATQAKLNNVSHITGDGKGTLFVIDYDFISGAARIRKVTPDGIISTIAGTGNVGFSGDGGPATQAQFNLLLPDAGSLALDRDGNLYVADTGNNRVRRIDSRTGLITTAAGPTSASGEPLSNLWAVAVDGGNNVYYSYNDGNHPPRIVKISPLGQTLATYGKGKGFSEDGTPVEDVNIPSFITNMTIDPAGNVVYSDPNSFRVRRLNQTTGKLETLAGCGPHPINENGPAFAAVLGVDFGDLAFLPNGELLIGDANNFLLRKIDRDGNLSTIAGPGDQLPRGDVQPAVGASVYPVGVEIDPAGRIYLVDVGRVWRIDPDGIMHRVAGGGHFGEPGFSGDGGPALDAQLCQPWDVALDATGNLFIADTNNNRIRRVDTKTGTITTVAGSGPVNGMEHYGQGAFTGDGGLATQASLNTPYGVAVDPMGNLYIADNGNGRIRQVGSNGIIQTVARAGYPSKLVLDSTGSLYAADSWNISRINRAGVFTLLAGQYAPGFSGDGGPALMAATRANGGAVGIAIDAEGNLFFIDAGNDRVRAIRYGALLNPPAIKAAPANARVTAGQPAVFAVATTGFPVPSFQWTKNGADIFGATGVTYTIASAQSADAANYSVVITNLMGSTTSVAATLTVVSEPTPPSIAASPANRTVVVGGSATIAVLANGVAPLDCQWMLNGSPCAKATNTSVTLDNVQPTNAGIYTVWISNAVGNITSEPMIFGLTAIGKLAGACKEVGTDVRHPNGNIFDQVLLTGAAEAITADYDPDPAKNQITRTSFVDLDDDIVQVEFSGPGTLSLVLDNATGPALPVNYNQATTYMKGHAGIVIAGATEQTNVSVFSVGKVTAVNQALFKDGVKYDGIADLAFIAILSSNGKFGGVRTANANYFAAKGLTGLYAPGVAFQGPVFVGNITAFDTATPVLQVGAVTDARITGGDLAQANGAAVRVSGLTQLKFTDGGDSHGNALPAQKNKAVLTQDGVDVTAQIVVNP